MTTGGMIFMILGWGFAAGLLAYCLFQIMKAENKFSK